jgi:hypothetical protein
MNVLPILSRVTMDKDDLDQINSNRKFALVYGLSSVFCFVLIVFFVVKAFPENEIIGLVISSTVFFGTAIIFGNWRKKNTRLKTKALIPTYRYQLLGNMNFLM